MKPTARPGLLAALLLLALVMALAVHGAGAQARIGSPGPRTPTAPAALARELERAQAVIDDPGSSSSGLAHAGLVEELSSGSLADESPALRRKTLALLGPEARASMRVDLAASGALSRISPPEKHFPPWRIIQPPPPRVLLGYFRAAQAQFGVPWQYLAAIEFVETRFGRIRGPSSAGAEGPMQFIPSTWAAYGRGNIDDQHDAIFAAARYLAANGASGDIADALSHFNDSADYVDAVSDYARRMQENERAFDGYYNWQVVFTGAGGRYLLPVGYPRAPAEPLR